MLPASWVFISDLPSPYVIVREATEKCKPGMLILRFYPFRKSSLFRKNRFRNLSHRNQMGAAMQEAGARVPTQYGIVVSRSPESLGALVPLHGAFDERVDRRPRPEISVPVQGDSVPFEDNAAIVGAGIAV